MENRSWYLYINTTKTRNENKSGKAFIKLELFMNKLEAIATVSFTLWLHCRLSEIELIVSNLALRAKNTKNKKKKKIKSNKNFKSKLEKAKIMQMQSLSFLFLLTLYSTFLDI